MIGGGGGGGAPPHHPSHQKEGLGMRLCWMCVPELIVSCSLYHVTTD